MAVGPDENVDVGRQRSREQIDLEKRDPIMRLKNGLKVSGLNDDTFNEIDIEIEQQVSQKLPTMAQKTPNTKSMFDYVFKPIK